MECTRCGQPNDTGDSLVCLGCLEARDNIPEFLLLRKAIERSKDVGISIPSCIRAYAMSEHGMDHVKADRLATSVENHLQGADWLQLSNGLTFDRGFDPSK